MRVLVSDDPKVYYDTDFLVDPRRVADALREAVKRTQVYSRLDYSHPNPYESTKLVNVVKSQIIFRRELGFYGDVEENPAFYEELYAGLTELQEGLEDLNPDEDDALITEAFARARLEGNDPRHIVNYVRESERAGSVSVPPRAQDSPMTIKRFRKEGFESPLRPIEKQSTSSPVTDAVFSQVHALVNTGADGDDSDSSGDEEDEQELAALNDMVLGLLPTPTLMVEHYRILGMLHKLFQRNRPRAKLAWQMAALTFCVWFSNVLGGYGKYAALLALIRKHYLRGKRSARQTLIDSAAGMSAGVTVKTLERYFEFLQLTENRPMGCVLQTSQIIPAIFGYEPSPQECRNRASMSSNPHAMHSAARELNAQWYALLISQGADSALEFIDAIIEAIQNTFGDYTKALMLLLYCVGLFFGNYHFLVVPAVSEAFLQQHQAENDKKWVDYLKQEANYVKTYFQQYYQYGYQQQLVDVNQKIADRKKKIKKAYKARKRNRGDKGATQDDKITQTNAFLAAMRKELARIRNLPRKQTAALPANERGLDDEAVVDRFGTYWKGSPLSAFRTAILKDHYENFQVWRSNQPRTTSRSHKVYFLPQPRAAPNNAINLDEDDDDEDEDEDEEEDDDDDDDNDSGGGDDDDDDDDDDDGEEGGGGSSNPFDDGGGEDDDDEEEEDGGDDGAGALGPRRAASAPDESTRRLSVSPPRRAITPWEGGEPFDPQLSRAALNALRARRSASAPEDPSARSDSSPQRAKTVDASVVSYVFARLGL